MINFGIVRLLVDKLRRYVVHSATESRPSLVDGVRGPPEITQFDSHPIQVIYENVLWLDIPVQTVVKVTEVNCLESLPHDALRKINKIVKIPNVICLLMLVDITSRQQKLQRASNVREHNR